MIVRHYRDLAALPVAMEGAEDVTMRRLIGPSESAPSFSMRIFEVASGGHTPLHEHEYEHEIFILEGFGEITEGKRVLTIEPGSVIFVRPHTPHQLRNTENEPLRFIDVIPNSPPASASATVQEGEAAAARIH